MDSVKSYLWTSNHSGYADIHTKAPMVAGDSSDDESDNETDNETCGTEWRHSNYSVVVGSERGANVPPSAHHQPVLGGPFSALLHSMWPQDLLGQIQQTEDSGVHPECEYDEFGFKVTDEALEKEDPDPCSYGASEDPSVRLRWTAFIESHTKGIVGDLTWDKVADTLERSDKLTQLVYSGIPHSMRYHLWPRLSGAEKKKKEAELSYKKIKKNSQTDDSLISGQIDKDLCRTMPSNGCFQNMDSIGIPKLKRVLLAVAWFYPDIGYCQGMGMIAGNLLLFMEEEDAFWMMVTIIEDLLPTSYYTASLIGVQVDQRVLRQLVACYLPSLDEQMKEHDIELGLITLHWFLTAMASVLNLKVLLRVWDVFFYEGSIVLFKITLGMMKYKEKLLLEMDNSAQIFNTLSSLPGEIADVALLFEYAEKAAASLTYIVLDTHRKKHATFLLQELNHRDGDGNNNRHTDKQEIHRRTRTPVKRTWLHLVFDMGTALYRSSLCGPNRYQMKAITVKAKNVLQTEIICDLRDSVFLIARHFDYKGTKAELLPDYSGETVLKDYQSINIERAKQRRAKALIDFERHEDDELGFRKNDLITIVSQKDEHCWIGELNGLRGWFPAKFVQVLDERSKEYSSAGDDAVSQAVKDLVRGRLLVALKRILGYGLKQSFTGPAHPWYYIQEASRCEVQKDFQAVYSRLVLCKTYRLDEDGKILTPDELLYRAVQLINSKYDTPNPDCDSKLRALICYGLNEQCIHLWFELFCMLSALSEKWYEPYSYIRSPGWIQIKYELLVLSKFSFNLSLDDDVQDQSNGTTNMKEDVQDMLVKHHLFSWDL